MFQEQQFAFVQSINKTHQFVSLQIIVRSWWTNHLFPHRKINVFMMELYVNVLGGNIDAGRKSSIEFISAYCEIHALRVSIRIRIVYNHEYYNHTCMCYMCGFVFLLQALWESNKLSALVTLLLTEKKKLNLMYGVPFVIRIVVLMANELNHIKNQFDWNNNNDRVLCCCRNLYNACGKHNTLFNFSSVFHHPSTTGRIFNLYHQFFMCISVQNTQNIIP